MLTLTLIIVPIVVGACTGVAMVAWARIGGGREPYRR